MIQSTLGGVIVRRMAIYLLTCSLLLVGTKPARMEVEEGALRFTVVAGRVGEGGPAVALLTRSGNLERAITIQCVPKNLSATAGEDYRAGIYDVVFPPGETINGCFIPMINDPTVEPEESFQIELYSPGGDAPGLPEAVTFTIVDDDTPSLTGEWGPVQAWPSLPIHIHLLPTGKVMFWDRHSRTDGWDGTPYLWNPASGKFETTPLPPYDLFCAGHTFMADGNLLISGGHLDTGVGEDKAIIYNPFVNEWLSVPNMNDGRWYPSNVLLPNGDVLVVGGTSHGIGIVNPLPQVWENQAQSWRNLDHAQHHKLTDWPGFYPFLYVAPNGWVFDAGPHQTARYLDPAGSGQWIDVARSSLSYREYGASVMYDTGKVLIVGGNPMNPLLDPAQNFPSATGEVIDLQAGSPSWRSIAPMSVGRRNLNATLLPDGTVLVTGGSAMWGKDSPSGAVYYAELWDPKTAEWSIVGSYTRYRGYHSTALLLPDGRVLVGGGGHPDPDAGIAEQNVEIFSPPYLFKGPRPVIEQAPTQVRYGESFVVKSADASHIVKVTWLRLGSVTHAFDQGQRINHLDFTLTNDGLTMTTPGSPNHAPPGYYQLFLISRDGVPSLGHMIQVVG
jgi:hypothetical protein